MVDPVILATGQSYERSAIERWLETHDTDPTTNLRLESKNLIANHSLRNSIQEFAASAAKVSEDMPGRLSLLEGLYDDIQKTEPAETQAKIFLWHVQMMFKLN
jgi:hypothetical protein